MTTQKILDAAAIRHTLRRLAVEIIEDCKGTENLVLLGIQRGGVPLAERLAGEIQRLGEGAVPLGTLDITLYRDDLERREDMPIPQSTEIDFDLEDRVVILVDEVICTGRTIRAALDAISQMGRPRMIRLAVLIDRGCREYPIHPDFTGRKIETARGDNVRVTLSPPGEEDAVYLLKSK